MRARASGRFNGTADFGAAIPNDGEFALVT
jgi:hypothetical protein